jgi:hypothetical protein
MRGRVVGRVSLQFEDGAPHCLVFSDVPDACRAVSHSLAAAYEDGKYVTDHPAESRRYVAPDLRQVEVVVEPNRQVLVEVPDQVLNFPQGRVFPTKGTLLQDLQGIGPSGGRVAVVRAGSPVTLSFFNSQRGTDFHLARVGSAPGYAVEFYGLTTQYPAGSGAPPHSGSSLSVSFVVPAGVKRKMLLTDYEKQQTTGAASPSPPLVHEDPHSQPGDGGGVPFANPSIASGQQHRVLPAGTLLQLACTGAINVDQVVPGKLFASTLVTRRTSASTAASRETLPEGTTVFLKITRGTGNQYLIQTDHAVVAGADVPLDSGVQTRVPMRGIPRTAPIQVRGWGSVRFPAGQASDSTVLLPAGTVIYLSLKAPASLDGVPQQ